LAAAHGGHGGLAGRGPTTHEASPHEVLSLGAILYALMANR
jgi:hypothetical protein